jgi:hypothetical protein
MAGTICVYILQPPGMVTSGRFSSLIDSNGPAASNSPLASASVYRMPATLAAGRRRSRNSIRERAEMGSHRRAAQVTELSVGLNHALQQTTG